MTEVLTPDISGAHWNQILSRRTDEFVRAQLLSPYIYNPVTITCVVGRYKLISNNTSVGFLRVFGFKQFLKVPCFAGDILVFKKFIFVILFRHSTKLLISNIIPSNEIKHRSC